MKYLKKVNTLNRMLSLIAIISLLYLGLLKLTIHYMDSLESVIIYVQQNSHNIAIITCILFSVILPFIAINYQYIKLENQYATPKISTTIIRLSLQIIIFLIAYNWYPQIWGNIVLITAIMYFLFLWHIDRRYAGKNEKMNHELKRRMFVISIIIDLSLISQFFTFLIVSQYGNLYTVAISLITFFITVLDWSACRYH